MSDDIKELARSLALALAVLVGGAFMAAAKYAHSGIVDHFFIGAVVGIALFILIMGLWNYWEVADA